MKNHFFDRLLHNSIRISILTTVGVQCEDGGEIILVLPKKFDQCYHHNVQWCAVSGSTTNKITIISFIGMEFVAV